MIWLDVVNVRFDKKILEKIDYAVKKGLYKSRSDALRRIVEEFLEIRKDLFVEDKLTEKLNLDLSDEALESICFKIFSGKKTAAELVKEGRGL